LTSIPHASALPSSATRAGPSSLPSSATCVGPSPPCRATPLCTGPVEQRSCAPATPFYRATRARRPPAVLCHDRPPHRRRRHRGWLPLHRPPTSSRRSSPCAWPRRRTALLPQNGRRPTMRPSLASPRLKRRPLTPPKPATPPSPARTRNGRTPPPYNPPLPWSPLRAGRPLLEEARLTFTRHCCSRRPPPSSTFTPRPSPSTTFGASSTSSSTLTPTTSTASAISFYWSSANSPSKRTSSPSRDTQVRLLASLPGSALLPCALWE
jgi:hypothetical protein